MWNSAVSFFKREYIYVKRSSRCGDVGNNTWEETSTTTVLLRVNDVSRTRSVGDIMPFVVLIAQRVIGQFCRREGSCRKQLMNHV